ncbi:hypothetical protein PBV52_07735 [Streptomyces sp. T12]|uniref:hypothetical protein n=1 Tax=Streptomyces sp. T12 TaxID=477697 RepID=UPI0023658B74|nr:hypothetical protein [Streptomyces sp. T12]WDF44560.1 hypothetical protein PBV52_07735 [Streptomyces sp. T12]
MDVTEIHDLPFVDAHTSVVAAQPDAVWRALADTVDHHFAGRRTAAVARLLGCADRSPIPGFHVVTAVPGKELALAGSHRFSTYALIFRLEEAGAGRTRLRAETRAAFPGPAGRLYRLLVIETRGHAVAVRRMLTTVRERAPKGRGAA